MFFLGKQFVRHNFNYQGLCKRTPYGELILIRHRFHKGGPNSGVFLLLVSDPIDALPIPTEDYGFHDLLLAQMRGDLSALQKLERKVVCINLGSDPEAGVLRLLASNLF